MNPRNSYNKDLKLAPDGASATIASSLRRHCVCINSLFGSPEDGATCGIGSVQWRHHVVMMRVTTLVDQDS